MSKTSMRYPRIHQAMRLDDKGISGAISHDVELLDDLVTKLYRWVAVLIVSQVATLAILFTR